MIREFIALIIVKIFSCVLTDSEITNIQKYFDSQLNKMSRTLSLDNDDDYLFLASNKLEALENNITDYINLISQIPSLDNSTFLSLLEKVQKLKKPRGTFSYSRSTSLLCNTNVNHTYIDYISTTTTSLEFKIRLKYTNSSNIYFRPFIVKKQLQSASLDIKLWDINYAPISLGICQVSSVTCSVNNTYNFTGIQIAYFGDNCYHIDFFNLGNYTSTSRSCLSKYELYKMKFTLNTNVLTMKLHLEDWNFFSENLLGSPYHYYFCGGLMDTRVFLYAKGTTSTSNN